MYGLPAYPLQGTILRSIETRRSLVRASNSGISAVVAPTGEVVARTSLFERTTLAADVAARSELTPYVRYGDWLPTICVLALVVRVVFRGRAGRAAPRTTPLARLAVGDRTHDQTS